MPSGLSLVTEGSPWELAVLPRVSSEVRGGVPPQVLALVPFLGTLLTHCCCSKHLAGPEEGTWSQNT